MVSPADQWREGAALIDQTNQHGDSLPPLLELTAGETGFTKLVWPKGLTSIGSYALVAEVVTYRFGAYW